MKAVLKIVGESFRDLWADLWTMLASNLFWLIANVLIIPGPPATLAIVHYGNRLAHGEQADLTDLWQAFRSYWGPAWRWGAINIVVVAFLVANIALTGKMQLGAWEPVIQGLYVALLVLWLALQLFALPFLFEQEKMSVRQALRNSVVLIGKNMGFSLFLWVLLALILTAGTIAFLLSAMLGTVFLASAGNRAVLNRLELIRQAGELNG
ncbi:MAG: hypothetical protein ABFD24_03490 [Anaerolineaceae bacterium]